MIEEIPAKKEKKKGKILFEKGRPGGPGRPRGSRNKVSILLDKMGENDAINVYKKMIEMCMNGDSNACKFVLERAWPADKGSRLFLGKRKLSTGNAIHLASEEIANMMLEAEISIEEGEKLMKVLEQKMGILMDTEIVSKIEETCEKVK